MTSDGTVMHGRLPWISPDEMTEEQRKVYDAIVESRKPSGPGGIQLVADDGRIHGPFNAMLMSPTVGNSLQELGANIRFHTSLPGRLRELSILEIARTRRSNFEFSAHTTAGKAAGLSDEEIEALKNDTDAPTFSNQERIARSLVHSMLMERDVPEELFEQAQGELDAVTLSELVMLVGYYDLLALSFTVFQTPIPDDMPVTFS